LPFFFSAGKIKQIKCPKILHFSGLYFPHLQGVIHSPVERRVDISRVLPNRRKKRAKMDVGNNTGIKGPGILLK